MSRTAKHKKGQSVDLAGIQYAGEPGISAACQDAVVRLLQYGDRITAARILSCKGSHCLLLTINIGDIVAVKSGFGSGYLGEGSRTFSYILQLLDAHGSEIDEYEVTSAVMGRLDSSSLRMSDLKKLQSAPPIWPTRWHDYIQERHWERHDKGTLWREFPTVVPFAIVDPRLIDLAISFWNDPDDCLMTAYRRLEDIVRRRSGLDEHGAKLFSQAFMNSTAKLHWPGRGPGEQNARAQLFAAAFTAYRNPRAHRETDQEYPENQLAEFLLLNHLFRLEREATS